MKITHYNIDIKTSKPRMRHTVLVYSVVRLI